jgi:hypothetical protein
MSTAEQVFDRESNARTSLNIDERALEIGEVAGIQHLYAGVMFAVKRRNRIRAAGVLCVHR